LTVDAREWRPLKGIALSVLGIGFITFNDAMMKLVVEQHPIGEAIFVRGLFALVPMALLIYRAGGLRSLAVHNMGMQLWCALLLVGPLFLFVFSLSRLPLSIATIIFFTNPLFVTLLAPWFLNETVGWRRVSAVLVGFAGATLVVKPVGDAFVWILLGPLVVALLLLWWETLMTVPGVAVLLIVACNVRLSVAPIFMLKPDHVTVPPMRVPPLLAEVKVRGLGRVSRTVTPVCMEAVLFVM